MPEKTPEEVKRILNESRGQGQIDAKTIIVLCGLGGSVLALILTLVVMLVSSSGKSWDDSSGQIDDAPVETGASTALLVKKCQLNNNAPRKLCDFLDKTCRADGSGPTCQSVSDHVRMALITNMWTLPAEMVESLPRPSAGPDVSLRMESVEERERERVEDDPDYLKKSAFGEQKSSCKDRCGDKLCARRPCRGRTCSCIESFATCPDDCCEPKRLKGEQVIQEGCFDEYPALR